MKCGVEGGGQEWRWRVRGMKCGVEGGKGMEVESERNEIWGGGIGRE